MDGGADTLAKLFDATFAGCGPCGGSCQPELQKILYEDQLAKQQPQEP
jgi:bacterioferritin-associated ferredoxin